MIFQYAHRGKKGITVSFSSLCGQVARLVLGLLHLLPPSNGHSLSISAFAAAPYWRLLDEEYCIEEVFCLALTLVDFLHYHEAIPVDALQGHLLETKRQVSWTLAQGPIHVIALWELWLGIRAELRWRYKKTHQKEESSSPTTKTGKGEDEDNEEEDPEVTAATELASCFLEPHPEDENVVYKMNRGIKTKMLGRSTILEPWQVIMLERSMPETQQVDMLLVGKTK